MRKKQNIHIPLPVDIDDSYRTLYEKKSSYVCPVLGVQKYHNVFVSHEGLCLQHCRLLPYSSFNICTSYDKSFGWQYYKLVMEQYFVSTYGKSLTKIVLDDDTNYALIHTKWANYSFWITSSLVRVLMLKNSGQEFTLLYPEEWNSIAYIQESLKAFPDLKIKRIPAGVHVQVKNLLLPEVRPFTACFNGIELQAVHDYMVSRIPQEFLGKTCPERIYVTRKRAKYRKVANEEEVIRLVSKYGFSVIDFDDMSFWEQVAQMQATKMFVSIHGAGYSNTLFMNRGTHVVEIINEAYARVEYTFPFWKQVVLRDIHYHPLFCPPERETSIMIDLKTQNLEDALVNQNVIVDIEKLESNIKQMLLE